MYDFSERKPVLLWPCKMINTWFVTAVTARCEGQTQTISPTLLHESTVDDPDGTLKRSGDRRRWMPSCIVLAAHCLDAPEQEDHDAHNRDGCSDARPHCQVKWRQQWENVDLLFGLAHQDSHWIVQVALAEIHHALALRCDSDGWYGQISSLWIESQIFFSLSYFLKQHNMFQDVVLTFQGDPVYLISMSWLLFPHHLEVTLVQIMKTIKILPIGSKLFLLNCFVICISSFGKRKKKLRRNLFLGWLFLVILFLESHGSLLRQISSDCTFMLSAGGNTDFKLIFWHNDLS